MTALIPLAAVALCCFFGAVAVRRVWRSCVVDTVAIITLEPPLAERINSGELGAVLVLHPMQTTFRVAQVNPGVMQ